MITDALIAQLIEHEGLRLLPYTDTVGKLTIGVGRNLTDVGITRSEAIYLLTNDLGSAIADLATFPWFATLTDTQQRALIDVRFNVGAGSFRTFHKMLAALAMNQPRTAADELRDSLWYGQVGAIRGHQIVSMLANG